MNIISKTIDQSFDLILCSQVLEHVWNHHAFFRNLTQLASRNSLIWINAPAANRPHGSPDFFSHGFTDTYIANNLEQNGFNIISRGSVGTKRLYFGNLMIDRWLTIQEHNHPILSALKIGNVKNFNVVIYLARLVRLMQTSLHSKNINPRYATESWVLAKFP